MKSTTTFNCKTCSAQFNNIPALKKHEAGHKGENTEVVKIVSNKSFLGAGVLAVLIIITLAQSVYAFSILMRSNSAQSNTIIPASLQDLPDMVGGC